MPRFCSQCGHCLIDLEDDVVTGCAAPGGEARQQQMLDMGPGREFAADGCAQFAAGSPSHIAIDPEMEPILEELSDLDDMSDLDDRSAPTTPEASARQEPDAPESDDEMRWIVIAKDERGKTIFNDFLASRALTEFAGIPTTLLEHVNALTLRWTDGGVLSIMRWARDA